MFDFLKSRIKSLFSKAKRLENVYENENTVCQLSHIKNLEISEDKSNVQREESPKTRKKQDKIEKDVIGPPISESHGKKIREQPLNCILDELDILLLEADVAYPVIEEIRDRVKRDLLGRRYDRCYDLGQIVEISLRNAIQNILKINEFDFDQWINMDKRPKVIMLVGTNGTGKTTTAAKIANYVQKLGKTVVIAACDTFRAGAIEQLSIHASNLGCKIVKQGHNADPAAVAFDAIVHAKSKMKDVVIIDTAGRMQNNNNLIEEIKKIARVAKPDLNIFIGDSLTGNDAINQAKIFDQAIGVNVVILTKIDTDVKGGAALSIAHTIKKPIAFICNGQEYDDIMKFDAEWMVERIFGE